MKKLSKIVYALELMRPQSVFLMLLFIFIPIVIETLDFVYALLQVVPWYFLLTGEIVLNDYLDREKDKINKPHRPIAAGKVSIRFAKILIYVCGISALVSSKFIYNNTRTRCYFFLVIFFILTVYNLYVNKIALYKTFLTALTTAICLCFVFTFFDLRMSRVYYAIVAFFYISGRELLMDIRDYEGDIKCNCQTMVVKYGKEKIYKLAVALIGLSQIVYVLLLLGNPSLFNLVLWIIAIFVLILTLRWFPKVSSSKQNKIIILLWVPILLTILNVW